MKWASGSNNVAIGASSLKQNATGTSNVAIGANALYECLSGSNNTMIGPEADFIASGTADYQNSTAIGYAAEVNASNQVRLGNNDIQTLYCMGAFNSTISGVNPNLYVDSAGQIMRITLPPPTSNQPIRTSVFIDLPVMPAGHALKITVEVEGATPGNVVHVSPAGELPDGIVIAYARVTGPGHTEIKFTNILGQPVDPAGMNFDLAIIL
jgi:hypothetical protein